MAFQRAVWRAVPIAAKRNAINIAAYAAAKAIAGRRRLATQSVGRGATRYRVPTPCDPALQGLNTRADQGIDDGRFRFRA